MKAKKKQKTTITKKEIRAKIKAILAEDPRYENAKITVNFIDKKRSKNETTN